VLSLAVSGSSRRVPRVATQELGGVHLGVVDVADLFAGVSPENWVSLVLCYLE
jgi:hypothetical protein